MTCPEPPEPPSYPHQVDEIDIDLNDDAPPPPTPDASGSPREDLEYLGSYSSIATYLRAMLEPEVSSACAWILEHLDYQAVQARWESDGTRLQCEHGHIYRLAAPAADAGRMPTPDP